MKNGTPRTDRGIQDSEWAIAHLRCELRGAGSWAACASWACHGRSGYGPGPKSTSIETRSTHYSEVRQSERSFFYSSFFIFKIKYPNGLFFKNGLPSQAPTRPVLRLVPSLLYVLYYYGSVTNSTCRNLFCKSQILMLQLLLFLC